MATLFRNFIAGAITDNPLSSGATVINASVFASLPAVVAPDILRLTLDPEATAGAPEIVHVTAHTASSTAVTVLRGQGGTTARSHIQGTIVRHDIVRADLEAFQDGTGINDSAITAAKLAPNAVTTAKILDANVTTAKIADGAVTAAKIAPGTITQLELGADSVASNEILNGAVTYAKLAGDVKTTLFLDTSFTPTLSGMAIGTGGSAANSARYAWHGGPDIGDVGILLVEGFIVFGTTAPTFPGATITVAPPTGFNFPTPLSAEVPCGRCIFGASGVASYPGIVRHNTTTSVRFVVEQVGGAYPVAQVTGTTVPFTWAAGDFIAYQYEMRAVRV